VTDELEVLAKNMGEGESNKGTGALVYVTQSQPMAYVWLRYHLCHSRERWIFLETPYYLAASLSVNALMPEQANSQAVIILSD
jgi:hypothetical protein